MTTPTVIDFYRYSVPRGTNVKQRAEWTTSSSSSVVITAATAKIYFIQGIEFFLSPDADLGANHISIIHSSDTFGGVNSSTIIIGSVEALLASFAPATESIVACNYFGTFIFDVPVRLDATETLTVLYSGGAGGITAGHIKFGFSGWNILASDL